MLSRRDRRSIYTEARKVNTLPLPLLWTPKPGNGVWEGLKYITKIIPDNSDNI